MAVWLLRLISSLMPTTTDSTSAKDAVLPVSELGRETDVHNFPQKVWPSKPEISAGFRHVQPRTMPSSYTVRFVLTLA